MTDAPAVSGLYCGPLTLYYAAAVADPERLAEGVRRWRSDLDAALASRPRRPDRWSDDPMQGGEELVLDDADLRGLHLLAVYAERSDLELPDEVPPALADDVAWCVAQRSGFARSAYGQILAAEMWLPGEFDYTIRCPGPDGAECAIGSVSVLGDQLRRLNDRSVQAGAEQLVAWAEASAASHPIRFVDAARRGLGRVLAGARMARARQLPLCVRRPARPGSVEAPGT